MKTHFSYSSEMPVSAKFYARLRERVHSIVPALNLPNSDRREYDVLKLIYDYLLSSASGSDRTKRTLELTDLLHASCDTICMTIFLTLKAEIDTAIERSRRARALAASRRASKRIATNPHSTATPELPTTPAQPTLESTPHPNQPESSEKSDPSESSESSEKSDLPHKPTPTGIIRHRYGIRLRPAHSKSRNPRSGRRHN